MKLWHIYNSNWRLFPALVDVCKFKLKNLKANKTELNNDDDKINEDEVGKN